MVREIYLLHIFNNLKAHCSAILKSTGSARSVPGFDVHEAIGACSELLEQFGGHKYAAGLTMSVDNVPAFQRRFEEVVSASITEELLIPKINIDQTIIPEQITETFQSILQQMELNGTTFS